ncbi:hypothetical protein MKK88_00330 [Methylobacterium sp. E-005]|uniref:hypothetical protein n=1 Tax=Methylobacterium sp. E-005 TaxID=2836549 RepID=UPI001FBA98A5|nr:hypothetical protein [Methylobacterium sp. E-005]MCJ2084442.1 hypothetical protein [Methylobacterium sp. E-005]
MGTALVSVLGYSLAVAMFVTGISMFTGAFFGKFRDDDSNGIAFWLSFAFCGFGFGVCALIAKLTGAI